MRRLLSPGSGEGVILCYHRVNPSPDRLGLTVTPERFEEHLTRLAERRRVLSLSDLLAGISGGTLPEGAVALTFDDGYADNLWHARPLLERFGAPATVFVAAGYVGSEREFWWVALERLLFASGSLPQRFRLRAGGRDREWPLHGQDPARCRRDAFRDLRTLLRSLPPEEREGAMEDLREQAGDGGPDPAARALTAGEVVRLAEGGLVEIGAHTVDHPYLPAMPQTRQRAEVSGSRSALEAILGRPVTAFAYPHGGHTAATVARVREAGFRCACTTRRGPVWGRTDPFRLPRLSVKNWRGEQLSRRLDQLL